MRFPNLSSITPAGVRRCDEHLTMDEDSLELTNYCRECPPQLPRKRKTRTTSQGSSAGESWIKSNNTVELLPIILQSRTDRTLKSFSPIFIESCLKCVGDCQSCVPLANANLVVTCDSSQQIKTFVSCTNLSDGKQSVPVIAPLRQPAGAKGFLYVVPLDLKMRKISLNRCKHKLDMSNDLNINLEENVFRDSSTVLLHFVKSELPLKSR